MKDAYESAFEKCYGSVNNADVLARYRHAPPQNSRAAVEQLRLDLAECARQEYAKAETQEDKLSALEAERKAFLAHVKEKDAIHHDQLLARKRRLRDLKKKEGRDV